MLFCIFTVLPIVLFGLTTTKLNKLYSTLLEWKCVVFYTFAGVNFLDESVPESRNLRLKFQHLSGADTQCWGTNCGAVGCLVFLTT